MPRKASNYANGIQYKIVCNDPAITDCYNGSCISFKDRKRNHKQSYYNPNSKEYNYKVYRFIRENGGWDNWTFIQLEESPCKSKQELVAREREIFDILKPTLNSNLPLITTEEKKIYEAKYRAEHKEEYLAYQKQYATEHKLDKNQYNAEHKDKLAAYQKQYNAEHKDKLAQKVKCVCGCEVRKSNLRIHMKSAEHLAMTV